MDEKILKKEKGITLIALVVTIVVIAILAGISINLILSGNGLFKTASTAKTEQRKAEILTMLNEAEATVFINKLGKPTLEDFKAEILKRKIVEEVQDQEDGTLLAITKDGYVFQISIEKKQNVNDIIIDYIGQKSDPVITNVAPVISSVSYNSKTVNSITISALATDEDGNELTYSLWTSTELDGDYTQAATQSAAQGETAILTAESLNEYTDYYYYVTVSDGTESITGDKSSTPVKTKCSGTNITCTASYCDDGWSEICSYCDGGTVSCDYCGTSGSEECSTCSGSGEVKCSNSTSLDYNEGATCPYCGSTSCAYSYYSCKICGYVTVNMICTGCGTYEREGSTHYISCDDCDGSGTVTCSNCDGYGSYSCDYCDGYGNAINYCTHGYDYSHYYCSHYEDAPTSHKYCAHNLKGKEHE